MELTQEDIELLDRYFRNELSGEELSVLQTKMKDVAFASSAKEHFETLSVVQASGRIELMDQLSEIRKTIEQQNGFEKYKPSKSGKGSSGGGGFFVILISGVIAIAAYLYTTGKLDPSEIKSVFPDSVKTDTVYHYNVKRDTVFINRRDTIKTKVIRKVITDTVYVREKIQLPEHSTVVSDSFRIK